MEKRQKNPRKRLNSLVLLVAFTAIMLIVSTYAWFSAQKNVTISGLEGTVNVAEGLMVSLDAKNWTQDLNLSNASASLDSGYDLTNPYKSAETDYNENITPSELLPVSATGTEYAANATTGQKEVAFYTGVNVNATELHTIQQVDYTSTAAADLDYPGLYAIDLFLQNSSKVSETDQGTAKETLQLNVNSLLNLKTSGNYSTGLQNTTRMALAMYTPLDTADKKKSDATTETTGSVYVTAPQSQILKAYNAANIGDVAIWEPNSDQHVDYVVTNNNTLKLTTDVDNLYLATAKITSPATDPRLNVTPFKADEKTPTYALTANSVRAAETLKAKDGDGNARTGIKDVYNWDITDEKEWDATAGGGAGALVAGNDKQDDTTGLMRQIALQTTPTYKTNNNGTTDDTSDDFIEIDNYTTTGNGVRDLVSVSSSGAAIYNIGTESGAVKFQMLKNSVIKLRLYLWLEGQDVDTINYASHGSGVHLDLGLVKSQVAGQQPS